PGRTALILLSDVGEVDGAVLAAAVLFESERRDLRVGHDRVAEEVGEDIAERLTRVPLPGDERLAERLLVEDEGTVRIALAERLDHLRHAHLWTLERRRGAHALAVSVYAPVAARVH